MTVTHPRLGLGRHLTQAVVPGDAAYFVSERGVTGIDGRAVEALLPLLDGTRSLSALVRETQGVLSPAEVGLVIARLTEAGLLREFSGPPESPQSAGEPARAFWEAAELEAEPAQRAVAAARVRLTALDGCPQAGVLAAFAAAGLEVTADRDADLHVVVCTHYLDPALGDVDKQRRSDGVPWLIAKPTGVLPWVGPVFRPGGDGPCWHCLAHRVRLHRLTEQYIGRALDLASPVGPPPTATRASRSLALQMIASESAKWLAGYRSDSQDAIWTLDLLGLESDQHPVRRRPQCAHCGDPRLVTGLVERPVRLTARPKSSLTGGGHRSLTPGQMMERYGHLVGKVTGVVTDIQPMPGCSPPLYSYRSGPNLALSRRGLSGMVSGLRQQSMGKGVTELEARVGALCEALERYSGARHGDEPRVRGSLRRLGDEAIHPNAVQLYDERQYRHRLEWNAAHPPFQYISEPFDPDAVTDWTPVWSLTGGRRRLLPTSLLYYGAAAASGSGFARADSNGCAAGSSLEDAVLQGFYELVERDAVALWWYNRTRQPAVDLSAFDSGFLTAMRRRYAELERELWVLDITSDLGVPAMAAVSRSTAGAAERLMFGLGCHSDPHVALRRALTEMNQLLPMALDAPATQAAVATDPQLHDWLNHRTLADQPYLAPDPAATPRDAASYGYTPRDDLRDDVLAAVELTRRHGLEFLVLDQTRPDIGLPVVRVLVPGLRHFWARFAPGRLYDVPVRLGRRPAPARYEDLNPIPFFL